MLIEEARQKTKEAARIVAAGLDHPDSIMAAADEYVLAMLEEATEYDTNHPVEQTQGRLWCCKYHMLRAQIAGQGAPQQPQDEPPQQEGA